MTGGGDGYENGDPRICERHEIADGRASPSCDDCQPVRADGGTTADGTYRVCLDLFSGLGGFSAAFQDADGWEVVTVDLDPDERFDPDIRADVMDLRPSDLPDADLVLASPPCTDFSIAASRYEKIVDGEPRTESARESVALVYHTIGLIKATSPEYWFLENPRGYLRQFIGQPTGWVTYCQYGEDYMKPTDLWGEHPPGFEYRKCRTGDGCHTYNTDGEHGGLGNFDLAGRDPAKRAKVPYPLSESILDAVEGRQEQATLFADGGRHD